jgi:hypothetical protein
LAKGVTIRVTYVTIGDTVLIDRSYPQRLSHLRSEIARGAGAGSAAYAAKAEDFGQRLAEMRTPLVLDQGTDFSYPNCFATTSTHAQTLGVAKKVLLNTRFIDPQLSPRVR